MIPMIHLRHKDQNSCTRPGWAYRVRTIASIEAGESTIHFKHRMELEATGGVTIGGTELGDKAADCGTG